MKKGTSQNRPVRVYKRGDRGFHGYGKPVRCTYDTQVEVYESSSAEGPHVWLRLTANPAMLRALAPGESVAHLNVKQAQEVIRRLQTWLGEVGGPTP